jgi:hypothetical protein
VDVPFALDPELSEADELCFHGPQCGTRRVAGLAR